jgi:hypothetical protein
MPEQGEPNLTEEERQDFLIASEKLLDRLKDKEALEFFVEVVVKAAEHMLDVLDEIEDEELKEAYRLIVGLTAVFKVAREHLEKLAHWEAEVGRRIEARGLKTTSTDRKLDQLRRDLAVTREEMADPTLALPKGAGRRSWWPWRDK